MNLSYTIQTRKNFRDLVKSLTLEQLNHIPEGYNNNIIWNFGHTLVTHQLLCYTFSGIAPRVSHELIEMFKKGTAPVGKLEQVDVNNLLELADSLLESFASDLESLDFSNYTSYTTSFKVTLSSIEEATAFNAIHEGVHFGYALALKKLV